MEISNTPETPQGPQKVSELMKMGFVFIMMLGYNRIVSKKHVKDLMDNVKEIGRFLKPIQYITAEDWFEAYTDRTITLPSGKVIAKNTENLEKILLILDGQHRYEADRELGIEESYESTLMAEPVILPDGMTPDKWMTAVNSTSRNWSERDRAGYIIALNPEEETNVKIAEQWFRDYGMSMRNSFGLLNYSDNYRKIYHIEYMKNPEKGLPPALKGTPENQKRGSETLHAIEIGFRKYPKVIKNMAIVEFIIEVYSQTPDKDKARVVEYIQLFLKSLSENKAKDINSASDKHGRKDILHGEWGRFQKNLKRPENRAEYSQIAIDAEKDWVEIRDSKGKNK